MVDALAALRARIREIEGRPAGERQSVSSGHASLDATAGGLPCPGLVEVCGPRGGGRTRLALGWAAARTRAGERVAWVDPARLLYPPSAEALGVSLERLLVVRAEDAQAAWAAEQLLASGCFGLVVVSEAPDVHGAGRRWEQAAWRGRGTLVVLSDKPVRDLPADLRFSVQDDVATVLRRRGGGQGARVTVPAWPVGLDPWASAGGAA